MDEITEFTLTRRKRGRPTKRTPELMEELIEDIESGDPRRTVRAFCARHKLSSSTVYQWLNSSEYSARYARARKAGCLCLLDQIAEIAFDPKVDPKTKRVQIHALERYLMQLDPKRFGMKLGIGGAEELPPLNPEDRLKRIEAIVAVAERRRDSDLRNN